MENQAPSSSSPTNNWTYDVFLSFHGQDTRLAFISQLYQSLDQWKIFHTFVDDEIFRTAENIASALFRAIQESRLAIILFTENYASSRFCLDELERIMTCFKEENRLIYPVFYDVDPSELRHPRGSYAKALARLEVRFKDDRQKVENWRKALSEAAGLSGYRLKPNPYGEDTFSRIISYFCKSLHQSGIQGIQEDLATLGQWVKTRRIGQGGFGIVYAGRNRTTGELCAIKEMLHINNPQIAQSLHQEVQILSRLEHQHIVKYYDSERVGNQIFICMEYVESGTLEEYIISQSALQESLVQDFTAQILSGLVYLHSQKVVHRDIKPGNLLVDSKNIVKLADFGVAKHLAQSAGNHSVDGTLRYAAPEVIKKEAYKHSSEAYAADIWSLGCVVIEMFTGKHPWPDCTNPVQFLFKVCAGNQNPEIPAKLSLAGKDFIESCFIRDPAKRPSAAALLNHPFVTTQT